MLLERRPIGEGVFLRGEALDAGIPRPGDRQAWFAAGDVAPRAPRRLRQRLTSGTELRRVEPHAPSWLEPSSGQARTDVVLACLALPEYGAADVGPGPDAGPPDATRRAGPVGRRRASASTRACCCRGRRRIADRRRSRDQRAPARRSTCTTVADGRASLCVVNDLLHRGPTTSRTLRQRYVDAWSSWPNTLKTDLVLRLADARIESVGRVANVLPVLAARPSAPVPQHQIRRRDTAT